MNKLAVFTCLLFRTMFVGCLQEVSSIKPTSPRNVMDFTRFDGHLLAYLRSPDQIFWFDFIDED